MGHGVGAAGPHLFLFRRASRTGPPNAAAWCRRPSSVIEAIDEITHVSFSSDWRRQVAETRGNPEIYAIYTQAVSRHIRPRLVTQRIHELRDYLKQQLYAFVRDFHVELLIVENALAIPMNIPLGLALTEFHRRDRPARPSRIITIFTGNASAFW